MSASPVEKIPVMRPQLPGAREACCRISNAWTKLDGIRITGRCCSSSIEGSPHISVSRSARLRRGERHGRAECGAARGRRETGCDVPAAVLDVRRFRRGGVGGEPSPAFRRRLVRHVDVGPRCDSATARPRRNRGGDGGVGLRCAGRHRCLGRRLRPKRAFRRSSTARRPSTRWRACRRPPRGRRRS